MQLVRAAPQVDEDGNGSIDFDEFLSMMSGKVSTALHCTALHCTALHDVREDEQLLVIPKMPSDFTGKPLMHLIAFYRILEI
jgi:hypothetical protein